MKITFNHISKKISENVSTRLIFKYTPKKLNEAALTEDDDKLDLADNANKEQESESEVVLATENIDLSKLQKSLSELKETLERKKAELEQSVTAAAGDESPDEEAKKRLDTKQDCVNIANELEKSVNKIEEFLKKVFADELTQLKINLDNSKELANLSDTIMESSATIDRIDLKAGDTDSLSDVKKILQDTNDKLSKLTDEFVKIAGQSIDKTNEKNREYHDLKDKRTSMLQNAIKAINPDYAKDANVSANMKKIFSGRSFKQEVEQLGDSEKTNPFIAYLKTLASKNLLNLLDEGKYAAIHNAYVDKSIYPNDLKTTNIGSTSIENCGILLRTALLNKGIWDISNTLKWYGKLKKSLNKELHPIGETGSTYQGVTIPSDGAHLTGEIAYDILFKGDEFRTVDQIEKIWEYLSGQESGIKKTLSIKPNEIKKAVADCLGVSEDALKNNPRVKRLGELLIIKGYSNGIYNNAQDVQKVMNILDIKQLKALDNEDTQSMLRFFDCDNNINNSWIEKYIKNLKSIFDGETPVQQ